MMEKQIYFTFINIYPCIVYIPTHLARLEKGQGGKKDTGQALWEWMSQTGGGFGSGEGKL